MDSIERELYYLQQRNIHEVLHEDTRTREHLSVSWTAIYAFWWTFIHSGSVFRRGGGLALKLTGWSVVVVYRASAGMRKGADGGHTDCELRVKGKQESLVLFFKAPF